MPIYEYQCQDCGAHFEAVRSMKDADAPIACKSCLSNHTSRQLSVFFAKSEGKAVSGTGGCSCGGCSGGSCGSCHH